MRNVFIIAFLFVCAGCSQPSASEKNDTATPSDSTMPAMNVEDKLKELGITLPVPGKPVANYVNSVITGKLIYTAGKGPNLPDGTLMTGKVGVDLTVEQGYEAARLCGIQLLASLKEGLGDLNRVKRIVKVLGMVNANGDFTQHPEVINGCSDLLVQVFGEKGKHARSAVGMGSLPRNIAVEIELIAEFE